MCEQHGVIYKDKKSKYHHLRTRPNNVEKCKSKIIEGIEIVDPLPACNITPQKEFSEVFADFVLQSNDESEEYPCDKCDKSFRNRNSLKVHRERFNKKLKNYPNGKMS